MPSWTKSGGGKDGKADKGGNALFGAGSGGGGSFSLDGERAQLSGKSFNRSWSSKRKLAASLTGYFASRSLLSIRMEDALRCFVPGSSRGACRGWSAG